MHCMGCCLCVYFLGCECSLDALCKTHDRRLESLERSPSTTKVERVGNLSAHLTTGTLVHPKVTFLVSTPQASTSLHSSLRLSASKSPTVSAAVSPFGLEPSFSSLGDCGTHSPRMKRSLSPVESSSAREELSPKSLLPLSWSKWRIPDFGHCWEACTMACTIQAVLFLAPCAVSLGINPAEISCGAVYPR